MLPSLITLRRTARCSRALAWVALIAFAVGAIFARDLLLIQSVSTDPTVVRESGSDKKVAKPRPSGISKRTAWSPTDPPDDDDETDEDADTVAPSHARMTLPGAAFSVAPAIEDAHLTRFIKRAFTVPIARRHATQVRGPPIAR
jgi:hypothetical protein